MTPPSTHTMQTTVPQSTPSKVAITTLGCKLNQYDSEEILAQFRNEGYEVTEDVTQANVCVVNTCAVTATAERKARTALRGIRRANSQAKLLAVGCMSERTPETLSAIEGVDAVLGNREKMHIFDFLRSLEAGSGTQPEVHVGETARTRDVTGETLVTGLLGRTRSYLKVQDGCSRKCTYCIIPRLRGAGRSLDINSAVDRARRLVDEGFIEIVLTGVALGTYGFDQGDRDGLVRLLKSLEQIEGLERIRLGSVEPWAISPQMLEVIANSERICPHLHIPLQSCDDQVLHRMNRRYTTGDIERIFDHAYWLRDDWGFGTDIIVGFPGETEEQFQNTQRFLEDSPVSYVHIFPYSSRPGTPASRLPEHWSRQVKEDRVARLRETDTELRHRFRCKNLGRTLPVLFENRSVAARLAGHADNYLDVYAAADETVAGSVCKVRITELHADGVVGVITP